MMNVNEPNKSKPKYETCMHVESVGRYAVFVTTGCPRANMIKGQMVSSKRRCEECRSWKGKEAKQT